MIINTGTYPHQTSLIGPFLQIFLYHICILIDIGNITKMLSVHSFVNLHSCSKTKTITPAKTIAFGRKRKYIVNRKCIFLLPLIFGLMTNSNHQCVSVVC